MRAAGLARVVLAVLLLSLAAGVLADPPACEERDPVPPELRDDAGPTAPAPPADPLAAWRSPVGQTALGQPEALLLRFQRRRYVDLDGDGRPDLLAAVPFDAGDGS